MRMSYALPIPVVCAALALGSGCATSTGNSAQYPSSFDLNNRVAFDWDNSSLFPSDQAVLSDEAIDKILNTRVSLPEHARLTVIELSARRQTYWSEQSVALDRETTDGFLDALRACPRIASASVLPSLLLPDKLTVPYLREAAARYQSNLLLAYRVSGNDYAKYRVARPDQVKAYCSVEAFLLDVRSGIVPFTATGFHEFSAQQQKEDLSFSETADKAFRKAEMEALAQVAEQMRTYLGSL